MSERCPRPDEIERGYWSEDARVRAHVSSCARCSGEWDEIEALAKVARELGAVSLPPEARERHEELRTALLSRAPLGVPPRSGRELPIAIAIAVAVVAVSIVSAVWREPGSTIEDRSAPIHRGRVTAIDTARFFVLEAQPDEIVRLIEGTIAVSVEPLHDGERFRVVSGDGEVEVRGTRFEVTARGDRLEAVNVRRGRVEVRKDGVLAALLGPGDRWDRPAPPAPEPPPPPAVALVPKKAPPEPPPVGAEDARVYERAWTALRAGRFDAAAAEFAEVQRRTDDPVLREDAAYFEGVSLARASRPDPAIRSMETFLERYPRSERVEEVAAMLGWLLFDRGETDRARPLFERAAAASSSRVRESGERGIAASKR